MDERSSRWSASLQPQQLKFSLIHRSLSQHVVPDMQLFSDRTQFLVPNNVATKHCLILGDTLFSYQLTLQPFPCIEP